MSDAREREREARRIAEGAIQHWVDTAAYFSRHPSADKDRQFEAARVACWKAFDAYGRAVRQADKEAVRQEAERMNGVLHIYSSYEREAIRRAAAAIEALEKP